MFFFLIQVLIYLPYHQQKTAMEEGQFVEVRPIAALTQGAPI